MTKGPRSSIMIKSPGLVVGLAVGVVMSASTRIAQATPTDVVVVSATTEAGAAQGLTSCNVYVLFDDPEDGVFAAWDADIVTHDPEGFYQWPSAMGGSDTPPLQLFVNLFPGLLDDSYVSVGCEIVPIGAASLTKLNPDFDSFLFNNEGRIVGGWFTGNPVDPANQAGEDGQSIVTRLTVRQGFDVAGTFDLYPLDNPSDNPFSYKFACVSTACPADINQDATYGLHELMDPNFCAAHPDEFVREFRSSMWFATRSDIEWIGSYEWMGPSKVVITEGFGSSDVILPGSP